MTKGDTVKGDIQQVSREAKVSKKGQPFTGVKVDGQWYQVWGDRTGLRPGQTIELEVSWAPDDGPVFCTLKNGSQTRHESAAEVDNGARQEVRDLVMLRNLLSEALQLAAKLEQEEAMRDDPPPPGVPF